MLEEQVTVSRGEDGALSGNALPARFCVGQDANKTNEIIRLGYFKLSNNSSIFSLLKKHCHNDFAVFWSKLLEFLTKNNFF